MCQHLFEVQMRQKYAAAVSQSEHAYEGTQCRQEFLVDAAVGLYTGVCQHFTDAFDSHIGDLL